MEPKHANVDDIADDTLRMLYIVHTDSDCRTKSECFALALSAQAIADRLEELGHQNQSDWWRWNANQWQQIADNF